MLINAKKLHHAQLRILNGVQPQRQRRRRRRKKTVLAACKTTIKWACSNNMLQNVVCSILRLWCCDGRVDPATKNGTTYTTRQGKKVEADIHFWCIGKRLGNTWLQNTELQQWLDDKGHLKVDATMRLQRLPNIFAAGDMTDIKVCKLQQCRRLCFAILGPLFVRGEEEGNVCCFLCCR